MPSRDVPRWIRPVVAALMGSALMGVFLAGCASSLDPALIQQALDDANASLQLAEAANAPTLARKEQRQAKSLLDEAIRRQQDGDLWDSYYLALRAGMAGDLAAAVAQEQADRSRLDRVRQDALEARLEYASLRIETAETRQRIAEQYRASAEADAARARQEADAARKAAERAQQEAERAVAEGRAKAELDQARFLMTLAEEAKAPTYDPDGYRTAQGLLDEAARLIESGDFRAGRLKAVDAYRAANETRLSALTQQGAERTQTNLSRFNQAVKTAAAIGGAETYVELARTAGASRYAATEFEKAQDALKRAKTLQARDAFDEAQKVAASVQALAEKARAAAEKARNELLAKRRREEQIAEMKDELLRIERTKNSLDEFARRLSEKQLESVDGLVRLAKRLLDEGKVDLAVVNADRAGALVEEAKRYAVDAKAAESDVVAKAKDLENVSAFTTSRGVVLRVTGDLFAVGRSDLNKEVYPLVAKIAQVLRPYAEKYRIAVEGHTDRSGNAETNLRLSKERAASFSKLLDEYIGSPSARLFPNGFGDRQVLAGIDPTDPKNRRIEIVLLTRQRS